MPVLDIRRHAQRQSFDDQQSALSTAGRAMCERLSKVAPRYALVVASPLPRAKETAQRIAGRLDTVEPGLLPDLSGPAAQLFGDMRTLRDWERLMAERDDVARFADEQLPVWSRLVARAGEKDNVLAVSHGGIVDLPAIALMRRLGMPIDGAVFGYGEGVRIAYVKGQPKTLEILRAE